jgi:hypothetical protein
MCFNAIKRIKIFFYQGKNSNDFTFDMEKPEVKRMKRIHSRYNYFFKNISNRRFKVLQKNHKED